MVEDQEPPAPIVQADLRPGQVDRAPGLLRPGLVAEEGAGVGEFFKDAFVIEQFVFVWVNGNLGIFTGIVVMDKKPVIAVIFLNDVDVPEITATLPALEAFKRQDTRLPLLMQDILPDNEQDLKGDEDDDDPLKRVRVLDTNLIREHRVILLNHPHLPADILAPLAAPEYL